MIKSKIMGFSTNDDKVKKIAISTEIAILFVPGTGLEPALACTN